MLISHQHVPALSAGTPTAEFVRLGSFSCISLVKWGGDTGKVLGSV